VAMLRKPQTHDSRSLPAKAGSHADPSRAPSAFSGKKSPPAKRSANMSSRASAASEPPERPAFAKAPARSRRSAEREGGSGAKGPLERRREGAPDEVPRTKEAPPRTGSGAKSRRPPAGGRPRRG
jgi:hypothetical protein